MPVLLPAPADPSVCSLSSADARRLSEARRYYTDAGVSLKAKLEAVAENESADVELTRDEAQELEYALTQLSGSHSEAMGDLTRGLFVLLHVTGSSSRLPSRDKPRDR